MYRPMMTGFAVLAVGAALLGGCKKAPDLAKGEALFKQHCAVCHPDGGNTITPQKTLHAKALAANNITKPEDIVKTMRNPGPGMNKFDQATIPDEDATAIAEYVLLTYK